MMKKLLLVGIMLGAGALAMQAQSSSASSGQVTLVVSSDAKDLAQGYEAAFKTLRHGPYTLVFVRGGERYQLDDVRSVKAAGGVIVVEVGRGTVYAVSAQDVLTLTEGNVPKPLGHAAAKP